MIVIFLRNNDSFYCENITFRLRTHKVIIHFTIVKISLIIPSLQCFNSLTLQICLCNNFLFFMKRGVTYARLKLKEDFKRAMLGKLGWSLATKQEKLWVLLLKSKCIKSIKASSKLEIVRKILGYGKEPRKAYLCY